jgi:uncharacterized protein involved in exopolysaccharide biosynthesis/Mrp family chromosome partitioning ATPase
MTVLMSPGDSVSRSLMTHQLPVPFESTPDDFDMLSGFRLIRRRIVMIVVVSALVTLAAIPVILGLKPVYHAESRLMIHSPLASTLDATEASQGDVLNITSETERLLSRSVSERVIHDLHLADREEFNPALRKSSVIAKLRGMLRSLVSGGDGKAGQPTPAIERIIPEYYGALNVRRDGDVIQIGFNSQDAELAAAVPNAVLGVYLDERKASVQGRSNSAEGWIRLRIVEQQARVNAARDAVAKYRQGVGTVSTDAQAEQIRSVGELNDKLAQIRQSRTEVAATIAALETGNDAAIQKIVVPDSVGALQRDLRAQNKELDQLLQIYGDNADEVIGLREKILKSRTDLDFETDRFLQSQRAKLMVFDRQERSVQSALAVGREQLSRSAPAQTELTRLLRVADTEQAALDKLEDQSRTLMAQAALPAVEVEVLSPAGIPLQPQGRGRLFYLIGAMFAALTVAVTAAFVREMMDKSVRSHEQLEGIPDIAPAGLLPVLSERAGKNLPMVFGHSEGGMFAEAVRSVTMALKQANGGKFPSSLVVTSAHSGEGKTLVARSLAIELVASGHRVLLVDGDLRCGDMGSLFKSGVRVGLNEFLTGQAELAEVIYHHANSGIDFIPRGNPSLSKRPHLLDMLEIVKMAKANGQYLIFDSASILASTDTAHLAGLVDRTLLVVQWAKTSRRAVEYAAQRLQSVKRSEILVAINNVDPKKHVLYGFRDSEIFCEYPQKHRSINA